MDSRHARAGLFVRRTCWRATATCMDLQPEGYGIDKHYPDSRLRPPGRAHRPQRADASPGRQDGATQSDPPACRARSTSSPTATRWRCRSTRARRPGAWSAPTRKAPSATSPAPSPAAASPRSPSPWTMPSSTARSSSTTSNRDLDRVQEIFEPRLHRPLPSRVRARGPRSQRASRCRTERSLGSVIKLLTPSSELHRRVQRLARQSIPPRILALVFMIKRFYRPEWGDALARAPLGGRGRRRARARAEGVRPRASSPPTCAWASTRTGKWRTFKLRQDFIAAEKVQMEDDITASVVVPVGLASTAASRRLEHGRQRQAGARTASTACSSARTTPSSPASTSRPSWTWPSPATSCPTSSR